MSVGSALSPASAACSEVDAAAGERAPVAFGNLLGVSGDDDGLIQ